MYGSQPHWQGRVYTSESDLGAAPAPTRTAVRQTAPVAQEELPTLTRVSSPTTLETARPIKAQYRSPGPASDTSMVASVRRGDTVYALGRRYNVPPNAIIALNELKPPYTLDVGQKLRIPSAAVAQKVAKATPKKAVAKAKPASTSTYTVKRGDTLYGIANASGVSVASLASMNKLRAPYQLSVGDKLKVPGGPALASVRPIAAKAVAPAPKAAAAPTGSVFDWPVKGALVGEFDTGATGARNDGINIAAPVGTPVRAARDGIVVYRGSELNGYGNLLLVKHDDGFVTAYAHNDVMLVRKDQRVRQGQVIAKVGQTGAAEQPQLHFEIRQNLKAVDPMAFLQK